VNKKFKMNKKPWTSRKGCTGASQSLDQKAIEEMTAIRKGIAIKKKFKQTHGPKGLLINSQLHSLQQDSAQFAHPEQHLPQQLDSPLQQ